MERAYLLLRNNQQCGPFTIGELLQQQLKPSDMIWIEGRSTAWTYLSELELIPFAQNHDVEEQDNPPKNEDEIEKKAEELRQRVLVSARKTYFPQHVTEIETYTSPYKIREDEIEVVDHRKERRHKRSAIFGEFLLTCLVIGLFIIGIYKGRSFLGVKEKVQNSVATKLSSGDQHAAQKNKPVIQAPVLTVDSAVIRLQDSLLALQKASQKLAVVRKRVIDSSIKSAGLNSITLKRQEKKDTQSKATSQESIETSINKDDLAKKELIPSVPEIKTNNEPVKEEKKGFLKGLFKKKKKEETTDQAENNGN
jgi:hypothetical protein